MKFTKLKKWLLTCCVGLIIGLCPTVTYAVVPPVDAVELDGNVTQEGLDDWENINLSASGASVTTGVLGDKPPKTIFWKGGSKDVNDISKWWYKDGAVPDKDDIRNAYAAGYYIPHPHPDDPEPGPDDPPVPKDLVFYFGADRYSNNGDAIFGFWFFQDDVGLEADHTFKGVHRKNDLFVIMEYPQGSGSVPFVQIMVWDEFKGDVSDHLKLIYASSHIDGGKCGGDGDQDVACAITNDDQEIDNYWEYESKSGPAGFYPPESLFEGRINVSRIFEDLLGGEEIPCFSSFMVETRSSRSETAQLKDFVLGDFKLCSIDVSKICGATSLTAENEYKIDYTITIENTGPGRFPANSDVVIFDQPSDAVGFDITGTVGSFGLDDEFDTDLESGEKLTISGSYVSPVNGGTNTVDAKISLGDGFVEADQFADQACDSLDFSPLLTIEKNCVLSLVQEGDLVAVQKDFNVLVCNTGDAPLEVTLSDDKDGNFPDASINGNPGVNPFPLDYAKPCISTNDDTTCGDEASGNVCVEYTLIKVDPDDPDTFIQLFACQTEEGGLIEAVPDGAGICEIRVGMYLPTELPSNGLRRLGDVATAKATSPALPDGDLGDLTEFGLSDTATCDLCPKVTQCNDNIDNDGDGFFDFDHGQENPDPKCTDADDNNEFADPVD